MEVGKIDGFLNKKGSLSQRECMIVTVGRAFVLQHSFGRPVIPSL